MAKIEIVQTRIRTKQNALYAEQFKIITMYEQLAAAENIYDYLWALVRNHGYATCFEKNEAGTLRFTGCDPEYGGGPFTHTMQDQFDIYLVDMAKKMLTDWHAKKEYRVPPYCSLIDGKEYSTIGIDLNKQQRGVLTKILRIENKRKQLLKR